MAERTKFACSRCSHRLMEEAPSAGLSAKAPREWKPPAVATASNDPSRIPCPHCGAAIKAAHLPVGASCTCPRCGKAFTVGGGQSSPPATPAAKPVATPPAKMQPAASEPAPLPKIERPDEGVIRQLAEQAQPLPMPISAPPPKPKPQLIAVVCKLCQTRMYAKLSQAGGTMRCPDCHSLCDIPVPPAPKKPVKPAEDDDFYSVAPLSPAENNAAMLRDLEIAASLPPELHLAVQPSTTPPAIDLQREIRQQQAEPAQRTSASPAVPAASAEDDEEDLDAEIRLEAPVERIEITPALVVRTNLDSLVPEPSTYRDDDWVRPVAAGERTYFERSPLTIGIFEFLVLPETVVRLLMHIVWGSVALSLAQLAVIYAYRGAEALLAILFVLLFAVIGGTFCLSLAAQMQAIVEDTANGTDRVENWPSPNLFDWMFDSMSLCLHVAIAAAPGIGIAIMFFTSSLYNEDLPFKSVSLFPIVISAALLLPPILFSTAAEGNMFALVSPQLFRSFQSTGDGWMLFYFETFLLILGSLLSISFVEFHTVYLAPLVTTGLLIMIFLYFRLLGRVMWMAGRNDGVVVARDREKSADAGSRAGGKPASGERGQSRPRVPV